MQPRQAAPAPYRQQLINIPASVRRADMIGEQLRLSAHQTAQDLRCDLPQIAGVVEATRVQELCHHRQARRDHDRSEGCARQYQSSATAWIEMGILLGQPSSPGNAKRVDFAVVAELAHQMIGEPRDTAIAVWESWRR